MSDEDSSFDPRIVRALREIPPVDPRVREEHIRAALAEIAPVQPRLRRTGQGGSRWVTVAAAALVLAGTGFVLGFSTSSSDDGIVDGARTNVAVDTTPVKGAVGTDAPATNSQTGIGTLVSPCDEAIGLAAVARYETVSDRRVVYVRAVPSPVLLVVDETTCTVLEEIDLP